MNVIICLTINGALHLGGKYLATYHNHDGNCNQDKAAPTQQIMKALQKKPVGDMFMM